MKFGLEELTKLLTTHELEVESGVKLICGDSLKPVIYKESENIIVDFEAPFLYILIDTLGKIKIFDIKRRIDKIILGPTTITLRIDDFPDIVRERND